MKIHPHLQRLYRYSERAVNVVLWLWRRTIWRRLRNRPIKNYLRINSITKLQIGAGGNLQEAWLNTDYDIRPDKGLVFLDATEPFPFADNTFNYIFNEHFIEHITDEDGKNFIAECFRVLKPGGKIRIATPDLAFIAKLITSDPTEIQKKYLELSFKYWLPNVTAFHPAYVINNSFHAWGHKFIYDEPTLTQVLQDVGFRKITRCVIKESTDENLRNMESHGEVVDVEMNEMETMIFEAQKL